MYIPYKYKLGIKVNGTPIPDPAKWGYQVGDLDTSGSRDAQGTLHRARVATKINYEFSWNALEWEMLQTILSATSGAEFTLTAPDPRTFTDIYEGRYYVGDRTGETQYFIPEKDEQAVFSLKLKFIEY